MLPILRKILRQMLSSKMLMSDIRIEYSSFPYPYYLLTPSRLEYQQLKSFIDFGEEKSFRLLVVDDHILVKVFIHAKSLQTVVGCWG
mmetsp:Transcript_10365/g.21027  ORF Transcript_10365/g.21027 Transcript_10365/m.21027 type:complete len:87 (-) Transcript_10365:1644-1904(-)